MKNEKEELKCDMCIEYIKIFVRNPRTHISRERALYTDYEIRVETNHIAFACTDSCVRRRYSDFQWLKYRLLSQFGLEGSLPELPPKRVIGRFKKQFLRNRQKGLQEFLKKITSHPTYLSDIAVHLFLQTSLSVSEIQKRMAKGTDSGSELLEEFQAPSSLLRSCSAYDENDSGFSYSTASSLNDCVVPHNCQTGTNGCNKMDSKTIDHNTVWSNFDDDCINNHNQTDIPSPVLANTIYITSGPFHFDNDIFNDISRQSRLGSDTIYVVSEDDGYFCSNYDADDEEMISCKATASDGESNNNRVGSDDDDELFFCFRLKSDQTYSLENALDILKERPKLTDRLFYQEDSDDCFRESEYDVIDTDDDVDVVEVINDTTNYPNTSQIEIKVKSHTLTEDGRLIEVKTTPIFRGKNKLKIGKVKSLPSMRFPIRKSQSRHYQSMSETFSPKQPDNRIHTVDDELIQQNDCPFNETPLKPVQSESDVLQQTSDGDYLTSINRCYSADSNIDTQAEDIPPTKFLSLLKTKNKKRNHVTRLDFSSPPMTTNGKFQVSTVNEVSTPDIESNKKAFFQEDVKMINKENTERVNNLPNGLTVQNNESLLLQSYEII